MNTSRLKQVWAKVRPYFLCKEEKKVDEALQAKIDYIERQKLGMTLAGHRLVSDFFISTHQSGFYGKNIKIYYSYVETDSNVRASFLNALSSKTMASSKESPIEAQYLALHIYNSRKQAAK